MRNTVLMIVLALLAAATWLASWQRETPNAPDLANEDGQPLGYYVLGARWFGTDEQGRVAYQISAQRLDELPSEDRLRLEGVSVSYRPAEETAWDISAATATAPKDGSELELEGNVELRSMPADGSPPEAIDTTKLRFSPDTSLVESAEPVTVRIGDWRFEAVGLRTDLKGDTLKLESQVHGTFVR